MGQSVVISSINFSGEQANVIFTPQNSSSSYGLGIKTIPFTFNTSIINDNLSVNGTYSINIINSNCNYILVI
jgi:hypothetical protein